MAVDGNKLHYVANTKLTALLNENTSIYKDDFSCLN